MSNATSEKFFEGVKAVFFDAGNTLLSASPDVAESYAETARKYGCRASAADIRARFPRLWRQYEQKRKEFLFKTDRDGTKKFWETFVAEVFQPYMAELTDFKAFFDELYEKFASEKAWRLFDDALPTLDYLKRKGYRLAVVSNWDYRLQGIIVNLGLSDYFEEIFISSEIGFEKPSPEIFNFALKKMSLDAAETLHVGDSVHDDAEGAISAGIRPAIITRDPERTPESGGRFAALDSLARLAHYL